MVQYSRRLSSVDYAKKTVTCLYLAYAPTGIQIGAKQHILNALGQIACCQRLP